MESTYRIKITNTYRISKSLMRALLVSLICTPGLASAYCNRDADHNLPDFSESTYQSRCKQGDLVRVKREDASRYCDKDAGLTVAALIEESNWTVFACTFKDAEMAVNSQFYEWVDNSGVTQFTQGPPPPECSTSQCLLIDKKLSAVSSLTDMMDDAIIRYQEKPGVTNTGEAESTLALNPSARDYINSQPTTSLCQQIRERHLAATTSKPKNQPSYTYDIHQDSSLYGELASVLSERFGSNQSEIHRILNEPGSIWIGMEERLLTCSRAEPLLIYKPAARIGAPLKQYIYELDQEHEYVDIQNGIVTNIQQLSILPES